MRSRPAGAYSTKQSPPTPVDCGSTTPRTAAPPPPPSPAPPPAGRLRLAPRGAGGRRPRRVRRRPAGAQPVEGGESRQRVRGGGHAVQRVDRRAAGGLEISHLFLVNRIKEEAAPT